MGSGGTGGARPLLCAPKYYSSVTCRAKVIKDYVDKALALDRKPKKAPTVDAVSEEVFGNLNETDQNELNKFGKEIAAQNRKRKIKAWKASEANHKRRKVGRGRGKGSGRGRRARGPGVRRLSNLPLRTHTWFWSHRRMSQNPQQPQDPLQVRRGPGA